MSGACATNGVVVAVAVGRWRRVTEARGGGAPTRPHRGGVAAWRGGGEWGCCRGVAAASLGEKMGRCQIWARIWGETRSYTWART
jgi:hypothetical protein